MIKIRVLSCWKYKKGPPGGDFVFHPMACWYERDRQNNGGAAEVLKGKISSSPVLWHMLNVS